MTKPAPAPTWIELNIDRAGSEIRVSARGSRGEQLSARAINMSYDALHRFASSVQQAATYGKSLGSGAIGEAQAIQTAVLGSDVSTLMARLREAAGGPLLVRLSMHDVELQAVPWEALCNANEALGFWGTSPDLLPVRTVRTTSSWQPREVPGSVKVLAIAPTGSAGLANLKQALEERIATGEIEWLDPVEGRAARVPAIFDRLRREPIPNVIHFLGHGGIDSQDRPALRMGDEDDEEKWLPAEVLAQQLASSFRGMLRLVVLEACEGAKPAGFASAAEVLAQAGADAVVAHLWPVRADVARTCSTQLYRTMAGSDHGAGDIALALNEARRAMIGTYDSSAEAMSPLLYLRAPEGKIFDFQGRKRVSPRAPIAVPKSAPEAAVLAVAFEATPHAPAHTRQTAPYPNLSGTWGGEIISNWEDPATKQKLDPIAVFMVVSQSGNDLQMRMLSSESRSTSLVCQVLQGSDGRWSIHGTYTNEPKALVRDRSPIHTGGIKLELGGTPLTTLSGHYWTDRNTRGEMNLRFISREIANDFAAARSLAESVLAR